MWDFNIYLFKYADSYIYKVLNISAVSRLCLFLYIFDASYLENRENRTMGNSKPQSYKSSIHPHPFSATAEKLQMPTVLALKKMLSPLRSLTNALQLKANLIFTAVQIHGCNIHLTFIVYRVHGQTLFKCGEHRGEIKIIVLNNTILKTKWHLHDLPLIGLTGIIKVWWQDPWYLELRSLEAFLENE